MKDRTIVRVLDRRAVTYDGKTKTAISARDGVLEYMGAELGMVPADRVVRVYRSPATVANAAMSMAGLPLTDDHVSLDAPPVATIGTVAQSRLVDDATLGPECTMGIANKIAVNDTALALLDEGKRELSLGYTATLEPADEDAAWDFEQFDIMPHHLALVQAGRCGPGCRFVDSRPVTPTEDPMLEAKTPEAVTEPEAAPAPASLFDGYSLEQLQDFCWQLPDALRKLPAEKMAELIEPIKAMIMQAAVPEPMPSPVADEAPVPEAEPATEAPAEVTDAAVSLVDAVALATRALTETIDAARPLVDASYTFTGKDSMAIMRDCVAAQHPGKVFADTEIPVIFKVLQPRDANPGLANFGDASGNKWDALKGKSLGGN
jgi:hypothetical protein